MSEKPVHAAENIAGKYQLTIIRKVDGDYLDGNPVDSKLVDKLLDAINEPVIRELDISKLGISQRWLDQNAESALQEYVHDYPYLQPTNKQRDLFVRSFRSLELVNEVLHTYYQGWWTDDYPKLGLKIILNDGNSIDVYSDDQHAFMIPWEVTKGGKTDKTYNVDISKGLCDLLSLVLRDIDRERICGTALKRGIVEGVLYKIRTEWDKLEAEHKIGSQIKAIKDRYALKTSAIQSMSSIDVETYGWNATLSSKELPSNVLIGLHIPIDDGKLASLKPFLEKSDHYVNLALSVPWFAQHIKKHPKTEVEIRFVKDRSMSEKAIDGFLTDMEENCEETLVNEIEVLLKDSCFLEVREDERSWSRWIVLPDKRMVLWHFTGDKVLKWNSSQFKTKDWSGILIACAVFSVNGEIEADS
ncbi:MAG: hypothetical protein ACYS0C_04015 [Planctomycetota bacterium]